MLGGSSPANSTLAYRRMRFLGGPVMNEFLSDDEFSSEDDAIAELRRCFVVADRNAALFMLKVGLRYSTPGSVMVVYLRPDRRVHDLLLIQGGGEELLDDLIYVTCSPDEPEAASLFIATDRTGEVPADRPDDELRWMELHANAAEGETELLDWFIVWGTAAFSVAEFAPIPPGW